MSKYIDITIKKTIFEKAIDYALDKTVIIVGILGIVALCFGAVSMMNDGKGEVELRIEHKQ
jgi:hypothetical protein